eukprot:7389408-Prymnesium_polylepis.1
MGRPSPSSRWRSPCGARTDHVPATFRHVITCRGKTRRGSGGCARVGVPSLSPPARARTKRRSARSRARASGWQRRGLVLAHVALSHVGGAVRPFARHARTSPLACGRQFSHAAVPPTAPPPASQPRSNDTYVNVVPIAVALAVDLSLGLCALDPTTGLALLDLMNFSGNQIETIPAYAFRGQRFGEIRNRFPKAVVLGLVNSLATPYVKMVRPARSRRRAAPRQPPARVSGQVH